MINFDMSQKTPEERDALLSALMELGVLDEQGSALDEQMAQAQALAQPSGRRNTTPVGAVFTGMADLLNAGSGHLKQQKLREQQGVLQGKKVKGRKVYGDLIFGGGGQPKAPADPAPWVQFATRPPVEPPEDFEVQPSSPMG